MRGSDKKRTHDIAVSVLSHPITADLGVKPAILRLYDNNMPEDRL